jgi:hypothetical protein
MTDIVYPPHEMIIMEIQGSIFRNKFLELNFLEIYQYHIERMTFITPTTFHY